MAKCNTQANDMAMTANNWQTPGASNLGRYINLQAKFRLSVLPLMYSKVYSYKN